MPRIYPKRLEPGDTVAIVSPASTPQREPVERAIQRLHDLGLSTKTCGDLYHSYGYLAGTDVSRAAELMAAFADPDVAAVMPTRGGYGISRLLDRLDYQVIANNPKIVTGFSDITALHLALQAKTDLVTLHSPNLQDGLGAPDGLDVLSWETYSRALLASRNSSAVAAPAETELVSNRRLTSLGLAPMSTIRAGRARGPLVGGNVSLIGSLMGTSYEIDTEGSLLLLEDTGEQPYRLDRWLAQLRLAGKFEQLAGVVLGHFTDCQPAAGKPSLSVAEIVREYFGDLGVPVVAGFPCGHDRPNITLPMGGWVELDADEGIVRMM